MTNNFHPLNLKRHNNIKKYNNIKTNDTQQVNMRATFTLLQIYSKQVMVLLGLLVSSHTVLAVEAPSRNPFTKPPVAVVNPPTMAPPTILPVNPGNNLSLPMSGPVGLPVMEAPVLPFEWDNLKVVGYINNNIILRIYDKNPQIEPRTMLTTFDSKFLLGRQYYTIKGNNKVFTIFNKNNQPVHRLNFESSPTRLITRNGQVNSANTSATTSVNNPTPPGAPSGQAR